MPDNIIAFDGTPGQAARINYPVPMPGSHTGRRINYLTYLGRYGSMNQNPRMSYAIDRLAQFKLWAAYLHSSAFGPIQNSL